QAAIVSKSTEIEFVEFAGKAQTQNLYSALCQFMIDRITTRILGQTMTTQHTTTGAFAMAEVQENVQSDIEEGDLVDFGVFISTIASYVDAINFGGKGVEIEFVPFRAIDLGKRIEIDSKAQQMGLPISQEYVQRTYNIPAPAKGETILERVAPTMPTFNNRDQGRRNAGTESYATDRGIGIRDQGSGIRDGAWVNAETKGIAKFLSMMRDKIRNCGSVEDLKAIDQGEIIAAIAGDLAGKLAKSYTQGRKQKRANSEMPELVFEFDERSIQAINAFRNQAYIISKVRIGEAFQALWDQAARVVQEGGSFTDFIQAADIAGFSPDNPYHLKTEYDTALAATSMAGRWAEIEDLADIYPYLRYVTVGDDHVREEHAVLDGYIAGINDPFWDENYPPNGYNCRCDVEQVTAGEAKDDPGFGRVAPKAALGGDFKVNTGKTDMLPSDAIGKLGENREETAGGRSHGKPSINNEMGGSRSYTKDKNNYPVLVGDDEYVNLDVLTKPDSIIHTALFITEYALSEGDWTEIIKTYKGRVIGTSKISSQEYSAPEGVVEWATVKK
ncbi:MAG TPA: DUF935 family protein, partial [Candidatus Cloacimonadota bacterium]|nr:DUF935 family protein [Candidatus Cloacimonadota bacterium]